MMNIKDIVPAPERQSDWEGWYVRTKRKISNGYVSIPAGSIMRLSTVTINKHLTGLPCPHCGVTTKITVKSPKQEFIRDFDFVILNP